MKLWDLPKGARIKQETLNDKGRKLGDFIIFDHIDGMYSYCWVEGRRDKIVHLAAGAPMIKVGDYYEIDQSQP